MKRLTAAILVFAVCEASGQTTRSAAPTFAVDPSWPKPLPNGWSVGPVSGIAVDAGDHIWIVQRAEAVKQTGNAPAPHVIEFDVDGRVVQAWGGPGLGYDWPEQVHGIAIDHKDRVWISGNGQKDTHLVVFSRDGKFLRQIGRAGQTGSNHDRQNVNRATQMRFDAQANEVFVSDGENGNRRVVVFDSENGGYKRHWGAYGVKPDDAAPREKPDPKGPAPKQFGSAVHCLRLARDGLVYVCDRANSRLQVFRKDGTFVREAFIAREVGNPSVWDIAFSPDERFMYVADGGNQKLWILARDTLETLTSFGGPGQPPGQFATSLHDLVVDSRGNLYTGEAATGGRVQKFAVQTGATTTSPSSSAAAADRFPATGGDIVITPFVHASLQIEHGGKVIQVDPWSAGDLSAAKPADLILITDDPGHHLDVKAIAKLRKPGAPVVIPASGQKRIPDGVVLENGRKAVAAGIGIESIAAYDIKPGAPEHPKGTANGYVVSIGGKRIYLAGVTECVPEVQALTNIDISFMPMNIPPNRMTPEETAACVRILKPKVVYLYHYDQDYAARLTNPKAAAQSPGPDEPGVDAFATAIKGEPIEFKRANWYPKK
jgi:L-ascorbate metabolism protein UlaG (beta-lactamase superfamily)/DNA-binding beta-propeller fold protein YncE